VKYVSSSLGPWNTSYSLSFTGNDSGRRVVGKVRAGVIGECKKEFEASVFATLETSIKLARGVVESLPQDDKIEQVLSFGVLDLCQDVRILLSISNLNEMKGGTIPKLVNLFENAFELSFTENLKVCKIVVNES